MSLPNKTQLLPDRPGIPPMAALPEAETIDPAALAKAYADGDIDLICVLGPTASGKTRYAVQLAREISRLRPSGFARNDKVDCHFDRAERVEKSPPNKVLLPEACSKFPSRWSVRM